MARVVLIREGVRQAGVRGDIRALEVRLAAVERRLAKTEGLLEGLRDAITGRGAGTGGPPT